MIYYIVKAQKTPISSKMMEGICALDKVAQFTDNIDMCDVVVCQKGWTRSKSAIDDWLKAKELVLELCYLAQAFLA